jgi:hypothetical protein
LWLLEGRTADLAGASLAATAAAWTKNEGQFFLPAVLVVAAVQLWRAKSGVRAWLLLMAPPLIVMGVWHLVRQAYQIEAAGFTLAASFQPEFFRIALRTLLSKALQPSLFNLSFLVMLGATLAVRPLGLRAQFWVPPGLVLWHLSGALLAYSTGRNDIQWWLGTSADRILSQAVPLALLAAAWVLGQAMEKTRTQSGSRAPASEPRPKKAHKTKKERRARSR